MVPAIMEMVEVNLQAPETNTLGDSRLVAI